MHTRKRFPFHPPPITITSPPPTHQVAALEPAGIELPDAPGLQSSSPQSSSFMLPDQQTAGTISGTVLDANGAQIEGALVTSNSSTPGLSARSEQTAPAPSNSLPSTPEHSSSEVISPGFASWVSSALVLLKGQQYELPTVTLQVASANTDVDVTFTQHDIAEEQISLQEKQRVLGIIPNFYVSYTWNAVPLTAGQKFRLAIRASIDPVTIGIPGIIAGIEQSQDSFNGYGQGAPATANVRSLLRRRFIGTMIGSAILPSIFHQDPRYFYKGTGTITSRALYAISTVVICKGDNGHWQPNYSIILGNFASAGISNLYYPATDETEQASRSANALIGTARRSDR